MRSATWMPPRWIHSVLSGCSRCSCAASSPSARSWRQVRLCCFTSVHESVSTGCRQKPKILTLCTAVMSTADMPRPPYNRFRAMAKTSAAIPAI